MTKTDLASLSTDVGEAIRRFKRDMTIRLAAMFIVAVGIILGGMRLMLP